jgi:HK97 family phage major capsid protein
MNIKLEKEYCGIAAGSVIEVADAKTIKDILDAKVGSEYTEAVKQQELNETQQAIAEIVKKEISIMEKTEKETELANVVVTKDAPLWKNGADWLKAIKDVGCGIGFDPRLAIQQKAAAGIGEGSSGIGGALITPSFISDVIFKQMMEEAVILPKCNEFKLAESAGPTALIKQVNETVRSNSSLFGGLAVYKVSEGSNITPSLPAFTQKSVTLAKAAVLTYISDEALHDIVNIVDQTAGMVAQSLAWQIDNDIVNGGLGIASPVVGDAATVAVTVAGGYPTSAEWFKIYNSMHPAYRQGAEWFMGTDTYASLMGVTAAGSLGYPIFVRDAKEDNDGKLLGKPINIVEWATASNTAGQILFANMKGYTVVTKEALQAAMSIHVQFISAQNTYRWIYRYASAPNYASKIQLPNSAYVSYAVTRNSQ